MTTATVDVDSARDPADELAMLHRALDEAHKGPEADPNPRVGCVIVDASGAIAGVGHHQGAGSPHAEVEALTHAADRARASTAYVTLEPCAHTGRTPPCALALRNAGIQRVVYAHADPDPRAAGGAAWLRKHGVQADYVEVPQAAEMVTHWAFSVARGRPWVTWKFAATLDGRVAAADGSSAWITAAPARADVHTLRSRCGAIAVGTGTVLADDPALTARREDGALYPEQPLRVVVGQRDLPPGARVQPALHLRTGDPDEVMRDLHTRGVRRVFLEGGPTLAAAMWRAGYVDEVIAYLAPALLGSGATAVGDLGIATIDDISRLQITDVTVLGSDIRITAHPRPADRED